MTGQRFHVGDVIEYWTYGGWWQEATVVSFSGTTHMTVLRQNGKWPEMDGRHVDIDLAYTNKPEFIRLKVQPISVPKFTTVEEAERWMEQTFVSGGSA